VFRTPAQKWDKKMIQPYNKGKDKSVMVWACFEDDSQKSDLVFMPGDPEAKWGGDHISSLFEDSRRTNANTMRIWPDLYAGWSFNTYSTHYQKMTC